MLRTAFLLCLLGLLAAGPATARPAHTSWPFWLSKPERHGSRKLPGDYTHINKTYRNHSRQDGNGLFSFLHPGGSRRSALARRKGRPHVSKAHRRRTSGIF
jgi:hypothetical protein